MITRYTLNHNVLSCRTCVVTVMTWKISLQKHFFLISSRWQKLIFVVCILCTIWSHYTHCDGRSGVTSRPDVRSLDGPATTVRVGGTSEAAVGHRARPIYERTDCGRENRFDIGDRSLSLSSPSRFVRSHARVVFTRNVCRTTAKTRPVGRANPGCTRRWRAIERAGGTRTSERAQRVRRPSAYRLCRRRAVRGARSHRRGGGRRFCATPRPSGRVRRTIGTQTTVTPVCSVTYNALSKVNEWRRARVDEGWTEQAHTRCVCRAVWTVTAVVPPRRIRLRAYASVRIYGVRTVRSYRWRRRRRSDFRSNFSRPYSKEPGTTEWFLRALLVCV